MIGLREVALVAVVLLVLYGRTGVGVVKSRPFQRVLPWLSPVRRASARTRGQTPGESPAPAAESTGARGAGIFRLDGNRLFWFLTILAAAAIAAWIATRVMIASGAGRAPGAPG